MTIFLKEEEESWRESTLVEALAMLLSQDGEEVTIAISGPAFYRRPHEPAILIRRSGDRLLAELSAPRAGVIPVPNRLVICTPNSREREWGLLRFTTDLPIHSREEIEGLEAILADLGQPRSMLPDILQIFEEYRAREEERASAIVR